MSLYEGENIKIDFMIPGTNIPGIFAAGDVRPWFYQENHCRSGRRIYGYSANTSVFEQSIKNRDRIVYDDD